MHHRIDGTGRLLGAGAALLLAVLLVPEAALAQSKAGSSSGGDINAIFDGLGEKGKAIGAVVGGLMLIAMLIYAWAKQSVAAVALAIGMGIVVAMAVNGGLWKTSENTAKSLSSGSGSGLSSGGGSGGTP